MKWLPSRDYVEGIIVSSVLFTGVHDGVGWWKSFVTACVIGCVFQWACEAATHIWRKRPTPLDRLNASIKTYEDKHPDMYRAPSDE